MSVIVVVKLRRLRFNARWFQRMFKWVIVTPFLYAICPSSSIAVVLNLGSRNPLGVPNANLGGPKRKSGISTNFRLGGACMLTEMH